MSDRASAYKGSRTGRNNQIDQVGERAADGLGLQSIFNHIPGAILFVNHEGRIETMNAAAKSLLGEPDGFFGLEDWPHRFGIYLDDAITPYPSERLPPLLALRGEAVEDQEMVLRKEGEPEGTWVSISSMPFEAEDGQILGAVTIMRDISYRKKVERSRERTAQRNEALYRLSGLLVETGNDLNRLTNVVANLTSEVIGDLSVIALLDPVADRLRVAAYHDEDTALRAQLRKLFLEAPEFALDAGLEGAVLRSGEPLLVPSILLENRQDLLMPGLIEFVNRQAIQGILIAPLLGRSGTLGTISLLRYQGHKPYDVEDQSFLVDISYRTALAIENCRLFDSLRQEISRRQATKDALDTSEERFRAVFEETPLGIKILDLDGNILQTNPAFQKMTGYSEAELLGRHFRDFLHPDDARRAAGLLRNMELNGASATHFEHRIIHKDGSTIWLSTVFSKVKNRKGGNDPAFVAGILEDVTARKRMEQEVAELNNRLRIGNELERLRLAQELHDGPMQELYTAIYGIEDLHTRATPRLGKALAEIRQEIEDVVQSLRDTAKELRPPTLSAFGLEKAIRSHAEDFQEKYPNIAVELSLAQDRQLLPEEVRLALFRVLQQALSNVARHSGATRVMIRFSFDAEESRLEISDNGVGFEVPSNLMDFLRMGHYGLAGAKERVRALGGSLSLESNPGGSTVVRAVIPWGETMD